LKPLDTIELVAGLPLERLDAGEIGTVVDVMTIPTLAYEVEFVADDGATRALVTLLPHQVRLVHAHPR
jgi:hypothetical protein